MITSYQCCLPTSLGLCQHCSSGDSLSISASKIASGSPYLSFNFLHCRQVSFSKVQIWITRCISFLGLFKQSTMHWEGRKQWKRTSHSCRDWKSTKGQHGWFLLRNMRKCLFPCLCHSDLQMGSSPCVSSHPLPFCILHFAFVCFCVQISPFNEDASHVRLGSTW